ncbi:hypothetical protein [Halorubrum sp. F4]|uniref:hypothetical protein n=1 Tax=Halorubrum sp. F4 TaxID=2989715 RepID=UPI002481795E|nr:hypothetical protein [Halorubrum sp. F4]
MASHVGDESDASGGTREGLRTDGSGESPATDEAIPDERGPEETDRSDGSDESDESDVLDWSGWLDRTWYRSKAGVSIVALDVLATAALVVLAVLDVVDLSVDSGRIVPPYVPVFSLLGALGFVFTALIDDFDSPVGKVLRYNFRLPAALPLGIGIFLLSEVVIGEAATDDTLVVGSVFLAGLYVNLAYKRLGALARRLLPGGGGDDSDADAEDRDDSDAEDRDDSGGARLDGDAPDGADRSGG